MITLPPYCRDPFTYQRRKTRVVNVGDVPIGGDHPIRLQSMTISDTMDTDAAVAETIQLVDAGCELVRLTAPSLNEAENLRHIKAALNRRGVRVPLIADIHFTPNAALKAAEVVEKVRINPGNYADKKRFAEREYTDGEYEAELERIEQRFKPLVLKLKQYGVAMRIGTNHGSLSDRIMNRFGDTPQGMVESALEFVRICRRYDYHDIVLSMKASNPLVMIQAYRLLAARMDEEGMDYPFHLGVTEAGDGMEGRVKSAIGIGALLEDGIGDTIRVSLTEDAVHELPAAHAIAAPYNRRQARAESSGNPPTLGENPTGTPLPLTCDANWSAQRQIPSPLRGGGLGWGASACGCPPAIGVDSRPASPSLTRGEGETTLGTEVNVHHTSPGGGRGREFPDEHRNPYGYDRRFSREVALGSLATGGAQPVRVELATTVPVADLEGTLAQIEALTVPAQPNDPVCEIVRLRAETPDELQALASLNERLTALPLSPEESLPRTRSEGRGEGPLLSLCVPLASLADVPPLAGLAKIVVAPPRENDLADWNQHARRALIWSHQHGTALEWRLSTASIPPFIRDKHGSTLAGLAHTAGRLAELAGLFQPCPVVFSLDTPEPLPAYRYLAAHLDAQGHACPLHLKTAALHGRDDPMYQAAIQLGALLCDGFGDSIQIDSDAAPADAVHLSYVILQAARLRMSKTEFISCPSCGRTLFNLQTTTERIKSRMSHLKDVKIAIMGCIVNGPGEMADADFGYVGSGPGKISLYVGKECVERNIPSEYAEERLIQLIKDHGKWVDAV